MGCEPRGEVVIGCPPGLEAPDDEGTRWSVALTHACGRDTPVATVLDSRHAAASGGEWHVETITCSPDDRRFVSGDELWRDLFGGSSRP